MPTIRGARSPRTSGPAVVAAQLKKASSLEPMLAVVLGSGFHPVLERFQTETRLSYCQLEGFPRVSVSGHAGELLIGRLSETPAIVLSGRCHFYEGFPMESVTFAVRVLAAYGIHDLLLTNAAGGINPEFKAGDFMVLSDHINLMGCNPLRGNSPPGLPRFVDMTTAYDPALSRLLHRAAASLSLRLRSGVYLAVSGPSYETPAEIRAFASLGADAVGMSTVPEAVVARQHGLRVAALSCITNPAAGRGSKALSHSDVLEAAKASGPVAARLIEKFARLYAKAKQTSSPLQR